MRIIFDNIIYSLQKSGGGSVYWSELNKRFNESTENEILFYDQNKNSDNIFRQQLKLKKIKQETFLVLAIRRYLNFSNKIRYKAIFHSSYLRISKSKNAINITTIHDFTTEKFGKGFQKLINLQQKKNAVKNSRGIICISENTKKDLLHFIPNVKPERIKVIYNGVSKDFFHIEKSFDIADKDPRFNELENFKYLLYVGHRTSYKNFPLAVLAAAEVIDKYKFLIIGEPLNYVEKKMLKKHLGDSYCIISKLQPSKLNFLYNKAFVLLYPSSYEGFGIPLVEAMKAHCPVIAARTSSIPEVAGDAVILYEEINRDLIVEGINKLQDAEFRQNLISKGILQSKKFNWDKTYQQYLEFYKELYCER